MEKALIQNKEGNWIPLLDCEKVEEDWLPIYEDPNLMLEMATRSKEKTGLPMKIWVDDGKHYINGGHSKRLKFQIDTNNPNTRSFGVMDLDGKVLEPQGKITSLSGQEIKQLRNFVYNNRYLLDRLADEEFDVEDVWKYVIKGGEIAAPERIAILKTRVDAVIAKKHRQQK